MQVAHRFLRNPNYWSSPYNRVANRSNPLENTLTKLEDPENKRTLYLIGTTNSSSMLAYRTKNLIEKIKPSSVFVQANENFQNIAAKIHVKSQKEMNEYNWQIMRCSNLEVEQNIRSLSFSISFYSWLFILNLMKHFGKDFHPFIPGLEMKFALESAQQVGSKIVLGGLELDQNSMDAFKLQKSLNPFSLIWNSRKAANNTFWKREISDIWKTLNVQGGENFAESIDRFRCNWFVSYFERLCPEQKRVLIDTKDEDLFFQIYKNCPGETIVAVVNQWHVQGIETHWRHSTKTVQKLQPINPIGDFDINKLQENKLVNDKLREITSKITGSEPATWQDVITHYHKEVQEFERTRHVVFNDANDHHMYHGLPYDSDDAPLQALKDENIPQLEQKKHHDDDHHH